MVMIMDARGKERGVQNAGSPSTRILVLTAASVQAAFHPKHSNLRPRSCNRNDKSNSTPESS